MSISNEEWDNLKKSELRGMVERLFLEVNDLVKRIEEIEIILKSR
jgi:hypothetical protein